MRYAITTRVDELKRYDLPVSKKRFRTEAEAAQEANQLFRRTGKVYKVKPIKDFEDFYASDSYKPEETKKQLTVSNIDTSASFLINNSDIAALFIFAAIIGAMIFSTI